MEMETADAVGFKRKEGKIGNKSISKQQNPHADL